MLPIATLWGEIQQTNFSRTIFEKEEQVMGGRCMNRYTVLRMSTEEAHAVNRLRESNMAVDAQLNVSPSSGDITPGLSDDLWTVTRTVDYDTCSQLVAMKINMDERNNAFIRRTSEGRYVVRGDALGMRVEKAVVEGEVSVFTSRKSNDHIDTFTNQTLELKAVTHILSKLEVGDTTLKLRSIQYEVDSIEDKGDSLPGHYRDMEERLTGILRKADDLNSIEMNIFSALNETSSSTPGNLATLINKVVKSVSCLSYDQISSIYKRLKKNLENVSPDRLKLYWQLQNFEKALILSGTKPAVKFVMDLLDDPHDSGFATRRLSIVLAQQITTSLKAPSLVPRIMDYAFNLQWGYDYMRKALLLNTASSLAAKFCFADDRRTNAYKEMFSNDESACDADEVIPNFIQYIKENIRVKKGTSLYELILIQTLVNLGTPLSVEILQPFVLGTGTREVNVRVVAMTGLSAHILPKSAYGMVYNLLMPIIVNREDFPEVRSMAFLTLASWRPELSWWKQMAISTWNEPSVEVANAISSLIRGFAQQRGGQGQMAEMASQVVYLTKPSDGVSFSHSSSVYLQNILNSNYPDKDISIIWFANTEGLLPSHVFINYQTQRLQGFTSPTKISFHQRNMDHVLEDLKFYFNYRFSRRDGRHHRRFSELLWDLREELGIDSLYRVAFGQFLINIDDFFSAQNTHDRKFRLRSAGFISDFLQFVPWITPNNAYQKTVDTTVAYPTDMGLPFIVQYSAVSASKFTITRERRTPSPPDYPIRPDLTNEVDFTAQFSHDTSVSTETLVPWLRSTVGSGITSRSNVFLPFYAQPAIYFKSYQVAVRLSSSTKGNGMLVDASNHPYTVLNKGQLLTSLVDRSGYKYVLRRIGQQFSETTRIADWTGITFYSTWEGDVEQPSLQSLLMGEFSSQSPTYSNWDYNLTYNGEDTDTKHITILLTVGAAIRTSLFEINPVIRDLAIGSQVDGNSSSVSEEILQWKIQREEFTKQQKNGLGGDMVEALSRIYKAHDHVDKGVATSLSAQVMVQSSVKQNFGTLITWVYDYSQDKLKYKLNLNLLEDTQGLTDEIQETCLKVDLEGPYFPPLTTINEVLNSNLSSSFKSEVYVGRNCEDIPVLAVQGNISVTDNHLEKIKQKVNDDFDDSHTDLPMKGITASQLYDDAKINIRWTKNIPESLKNLGRRFYNFVDRFLQGYSSEAICDDNESSPSSSTGAVDIAAININASKNPQTGRVTIETSFPEKDCEQTSDLPYFLASPAAAIDAFTQDILNGGNPGICTIGSDRVHNFDGAIIPFTPNNCWRVAVLDIDSTSFAIQLRFTTHWEVKFLTTDDIVYFENNNGTAMVRRKESSSPDEIYTVFNLESGNLLVFSNGISIKISNKVEIHLLPSTGRSSISGLCGNYDGERIHEMIGPKGCILNDPSLFASAWEVSGDEGCDQRSHEDRKMKVEEYRDNCQIGYYKESGVNNINLNDINQCFTWEYLQRTEGLCNCKAMTPILTCRSGCFSNTTAQEKILFECQQAEETTHEAANCRIVSLTINYPNDCRLI